MNLPARFHKLRMAVIALYGLFDCRCGDTLLRYIGKPDVDELSLVALHKRRTLKGRKENFPVHALALVVNDGVLVSVAGSQLRIAGCKTGPDFRADVAAAAVLVGVVNKAGKGRLQSRPQVCLAGSVFHPVGYYIGEPVLSQDRSVYVSSVTLHSRQPDNL